jgi:hypothetical protein
MQVLDVVIPSLLDGCIDKPLQSPWHASFLRSPAF